MAGVLGEERPESAGGESFDLSRVMLGEHKAGPVRTTVILQTGKNQLAFRDGDWKIVSRKKTRWEGNEAHIDRDALEFYKLVEDPAEMENLARSDRERTQAMRRKLLGLIKSGRFRPSSRNGRALWVG